MVKRQRLFWLAVTLISLAIAIGGLLWGRVEIGAGGKVRGILNGTPCAPPCWQGIIPGVTWDHDALVRQLRRMQGVKTVWENGACIMWFWEKWEGYNSICVDQNGMVKSILLTVDFDLRGEEIVDKYGVPEATNATYGGVPERPYVVLNRV